MKTKMTRKRRLVDARADTAADADADADTYYSRHQPPKRKGLHSLRDPSALDRTWPLSSSAFALIRTFHFYRRGDELACLERFLIWAKYQHWGQRYSNKNISFHQKQGRACLFGKWGLRRWWSIDALPHNLVYLCTSYWNDFLLWHLGRKFSSFQERVLVFT